MSRRPIFTAQNLDARGHREEDLALGRVGSHQSARPSTADTLNPPAPAASRPESSLEPSPSMSPTPQRRRVAFPDPVAFKFLEEDPGVTVIERRQQLQGYELYLVEQWACSRESPTLVIVAYTGDTKHQVTVGVLGIPAEEKDWSPRLRLYFKSTQQYHARPKETEFGELMVTNLSSFPSALTVIPIPGGDIRKHRQVFIINEDLKRLGCSGRSGMTLSEPTPATQAKFLQLYKTSEKIPFFQAVLELVKLCQVALFIFGKLEQEYIDGLLCDKTETGINNWWTEVGSEYYNIEPTDGILGPTTVAALLGMLMGARNRLSSWGAAVSKDVFDIDTTKRAIGTFQKSYKLDRTRRLDRQTLLKLQSVTAKAAAGEGGWGVHKAVKSTVAEIGGKRGEMVIGMVGGQKKANIGDIETLDLDKFISLAAGERAKWLWYGKPRRTVPDHHEHDMGTLLFKKETREDSNSAQLPNRRTQSMPVNDEVDNRSKEDSPIYSAPAPGSTTSVLESSPGENVNLRKGLIKSVAGKVSDARSGFGRIRDGVGGVLKGHASRPSKDETPSAFSSNPSIATLAQSSATLSSPGAPPRAFTWKNKPEEYRHAFRREEKETPTTAAPVQSGGTLSDTETPVPITAIQQDLRFPQEPQKPLTTLEEKKTTESQMAEIRKEMIVSDSSVAGSVVDEADLQGPILAAERAATTSLCVLQRRHSINTSSLAHPPDLNDARYPRRLSFSEAEEAILRWPEIAEIVEPNDATGPMNPSNTELARQLYAHLQTLQTSLAPWANSKLASVESLDEIFAQHQADLQSLYWALAEAHARIRHGSDELLAEQRAHLLAEAVKDVETLVAKLEYEIGALVGRVQELEDGVALFEAQVGDVERRADELKVVLETESWLHWFVRTLTGIGTGPNITRGPTTARTPATAPGAAGADAERLPLLRGERR